MAKKNKNIEPVVHKTTAEMVADFLAAGGTIQKLPTRPAPGAYRSGVVGAMSKK